MASPDTWSAPPMNPSPMIPARKTAVDMAVSYAPALPHARNAAVPPVLAGLSAPRQAVTALDRCPAPAEGPAHRLFRLPVCRPAGQVVALAGVGPGVVVIAPVVLRPAVLAEDHLLEAVALAQGLEVHPAAGHGAGAGGVQQA